MSSTFKINAGAKLVNFNTPNIEWSDFCLGNELGCARYKTLDPAKRKPDFGFIKILSDKILVKDFLQYCKDTFKELKMIDRNLLDYSEKTEKSHTQCTWKSKNETTFMIWKDGVSLLLSTTEENPQPRANTLINQAKFYERR